MQQLLQKRYIKYGKMTKNIKNIRILFHFIKKSVIIIEEVFILKEEIDMRIAICDDEINALKQTSNTIKKVFQEMKLQCVISEFTNEIELLNSKKQHDVVFLDIELSNPDRNGVWVAKKLKRRDPDCIIIFITNYEEYIDEVIEKYAFRYWSKPIDEYRLRRSIVSIIERMKTITAEVHETKRDLEFLLRDIIYITPEDKHCKIVTTHGEYIVTDSFKELKEQFTTQNFCSCHGSYCINLNYVERYTKSEVYLRYKNKEYKVHISRRQYKNFKDQMFIVGGEQV